MQLYAHQYGDAGLMGRVADPQMVPQRGQYSMRPSTSRDASGTCPLLVRYRPHGCKSRPSDSASIHEKIEGPHVYVYVYVRACSPRPSVETLQEVFATHELYQTHAQVTLSLSVYSVCLSKS